MRVTVIQGRKRKVKQVAKCALRTRTWVVRFGSEEPHRVPGLHETKASAAAVVRSVFHLTRLPRGARLVEV
jgi:hypothetical protein